jgi:hypothetical protein
MLDEQADVIRAGAERDAIAMQHENALAHITDEQQRLERENAVLQAELEMALHNYKPKAIIDAGAGILQMQECELGCFHALVHRTFNASR